VISLDGFSLTEHEDGTITVNQQIHLSDGKQLRPWTLEKNVWKEVQ